MNHSVDDRCLAAPVARREEGAYSPYVTEEQRRQRGWIGAENDRVIHAGPTSLLTATARAGRNDDAQPETVLSSAP
jgi:hypothetical protein